MPEGARTELRTVCGRDLKIHRRSPRLGEWLAWCYVPAASGMPHEGVGFEARAATEEAAVAELVVRLEKHLAG